MQPKNTPVTASGGKVGADSGRIESETITTIPLADFPALIGWSRFAREAERSGNEVVVRGADSVIKFVTIIFPTYVAALTFIIAGAPASQFAAMARMATLYPFVFWLASFLTAVSVQMPWTWRGAQHGVPESLRSAYLIMVIRKRRLLFFAAGLACLGVVFALVTFSKIWSVS